MSHRTSWTQRAGTVPAEGFTLHHPNAKNIAGRTATFVSASAYGPCSGHLKSDSSKKAHVTPQGEQEYSPLFSPPKKRSFVCIQNMGRWRSNLSPLNKFYLKPISDSTMTLSFKKKKKAPMLPVLIFVYFCLDAIQVLQSKNCFLTRSLHSAS